MPKKETTADAKETTPASEEPKGHHLSPLRAREIMDNAATTALQNNIFMEELSIGLRAAWPATKVETVDHKRLIIDTRSAITNVNKDFKLLVWDAHNGLVDLTDPKIIQKIDYKATRTPLGALQTIATCTSSEGTSKPPDMSNKCVFLMLEFSDYLNLPLYKAEQCREVVRACLPKFKNKNLMFIFQGASVDIPASLKEYIKPLPYPYPDAKALEYALDHLTQSAMHSNKQVKQPPKEFKELATRAALGLSASNAEATFARACIKNNYVFDRKYVEIVSDETKRGIREQGLVEVVDAKGGFDESFAGYRNARLIIEDDMKAFSKEARAAGVDKPTGCLLGSRAGCGKSQLVKATAAEFTLPLLKIDAGSIKDSKYGESEKRLKKILQLPHIFREGGCIMWIDEAEKLIGAFSRKGDDSTSGTGSCLMQIILTYLQERNDDPMDNAYLMLTFNDGRQLPDALLRPGRFDTRIWLKLPDAAERESIFDLHLSKRKRKCKDFPIEDIVAATKHWSGAEIEGVIKTMTLRAFTRQRKDEANLLTEIIEDIEPAFLNPDSEGHVHERWAMDSHYLQSKELREEVEEVVHEETSSSTLL